MSQVSPSNPPPRDTLPGRNKAGMGPIQLGVQPAVSAGTAIAIGFAVGRERVLRRSTALSALLGVALVIVGALIERRAGPAGAVDRALLATFRLVIPLVSFAITVEATGRRNLREGVWPIARYGIACRAVALGVLIAGALAAMALGALFAATSVAVAHGSSAPPLLRDAFQSAWIAGVTASAYTAWFSLGATFGKGGQGAFIPLFADLLFGGLSGVVGAILPRGNAQSLLGFAAPLHLTQPMSSAILFATAATFTLLAALRCRR